MLNTPGSAGRKAYACLACDEGFAGVPLPIANHARVFSVCVCVCASCRTNLASSKQARRLTNFHGGFNIVTRQKAGGSGWRAVLFQGGVSGLMATEESSHRFVHDFVSRHGTYGMPCHVDAVFVCSRHPPPPIPSSAATSDETVEKRGEEWEDFGEAGCSSQFESGVRNVLEQRRAPRIDALGQVAAAVVPEQGRGFLLQVNGCFDLIERILV
ncbi:unnamed protein product [Scytosiphon promiscuus]